MSESVDWYLHRKNCATCTKSEAWLSENSIAVTEQVDARKHRFTEKEAWQLMSGCTQVYIARGKSWAAYDLTDETQAAEISQKMLGPHGTMRAPAMRFGKVFAIGFNPEMLDEVCEQ
jgi:arsenate reductase-like glutaredoxin family protein